MFIETRDTRPCVRNLFFFFFFFLNRDGTSVSKIEIANIRIELFNHLEKYVSSRIIRQSQSIFRCIFMLKFRKKYIYMYTFHFFFIYNG